MLGKEECNRLHQGPLVGAVAHDADVGAGVKRCVVRLYEQAAVANGKMPGVEAPSEDRLGFHFQPHGEIAAAKWQLRIVGSGFGPDARQAVAVDRIFAKYGQGNQALQNSDGNSTICGFHAASTLFMRARRPRRVRSNNQPPPKKSIPMSMRLAERPTLSMTSEK